MKRLNRRSNGSYRFLVAYPLKLRRLIPSLPSQYSRELPSIDDSSTELAKLTAVAKATEAYNLHLKMLQVSDPQSYTESERALAIDEVLRRREIKAGEFHYDDFSDEAFPELGTSIPPDNDRKKPLTFRESVLIDAYFTSRKLPTIRVRNKL